MARHTCAPWTDLKVLGMRSSEWGAGLSTMSRQVDHDVKNVTRQMREGRKVRARFACSAARRCASTVPPRLAATRSSPARALLALRRAVRLWGPGVENRTVSKNGLALLQ